MTRGLSTGHARTADTLAVRVLTIDGPGGVGKGTLASQLAKRLGWHILDSGQLYRVLAHAAGLAGIGEDQAARLGELAQDLPVDFRHQGDAVRVFLNGRELGVALRTEECGQRASVIARYPPVRAALLQRQRAFRQAPGLVADGRDMGTVVFPDAPIKIYLTASLAARTNRRHKQLKGKGNSDSLRDLSATMAKRDARDSQRATAPLRPAPDALRIDTTEMSAAAVLEKVSEHVARVWPDLAQCLR